MKHFCGIVFSDENIDVIEKSFPPFEVCGNDAVTELSLPQYFGAYLWITAAC